MPANTLEIPANAISFLAFTVSLTAFVRYFNPWTQYFALVSLKERVTDRWIGYGEAGLLPPLPYQIDYLTVLERLEDRTRDLVFITNTPGIRSYVRAWCKIFLLKSLISEAQRFHIALLTACEDKRKLQKKVMSARDLEELHKQCERLIAPFMRNIRVPTAGGSNERAAVPSIVIERRPEALAKPSALEADLVRRLTDESRTPTLEVENLAEDRPKRERLAGLGAILSWPLTGRQSSKAPDSVSAIRKDA